MDRSVRGQMNHLNWLISSAPYQAATTVPTQPPKKPSQVFLGDSLMSGVRPKKKPAR
jgi:hypothetical protein